MKNGLWEYGWLTEWRNTDRSGHKVDPEGGTRHD